MKKKEYRIKEEKRSNGSRFYIQYKNFFGRWINWEYGIYYFKDMQQALKYLKEDILGDIEIEYHSIPK